MKKIWLALGLCVFSFVVSGCGYFDTSGLDVENTEYVQDPANPARIIEKKKAEQEYGSKISLFNSTPTEDEDEFQVNKYLWDACVDVLGDFPAQVSDSAVGLYETEYMKNSKGLVKVRCRIKGSKILSDNLEVTVFEKADASAAATSFPDTTLKANMLLRARELRTKNLSQE